jgi:hypothetical protein
MHLTGSLAPRYLQSPALPCPPSYLLTACLELPCKLLREDNGFSLLGWTLQRRASSSKNNLQTDINFRNLKAKSDAGHSSRPSSAFTKAKKEKGRGAHVTAQATRHRYQDAKGWEGRKGSDPRSQDQAAGEERSMAQSHGRRHAKACIQIQRVCCLRRAGLWVAGRGPCVDCQCPRIVPSVHSGRSCLSTHLLSQSPLPSHNDLEP